VPGSASRVPAGRIALALPEHW